MTHTLFLQHRTLPGRRDEVVAAWQQFMPQAIAGNDGHVAYAYTTDQDDPDALHVFQQYRDAESASAFLQHPEYLKYLQASEHLLAGPPVVASCTAVWTKAIA